MDPLALSRIAIIVTVIFAGLNLHQLTLSYAYFSERIAEIKKVMDGGEELSRIRWASIVLYFVLPGIYLLLLYFAQIAPVLLLAGVAKFAATAGVGIYTEQTVFYGKGYNEKLHALGKFDNALNALYSVAVLYSLIRPI